MGASGWDYIEPFDTDLATTLANLRRRVFDEDDYFWFDSIPKPATFAELEALFAEIAALELGENDYDDPRIIELTDIASSGTHSILDAGGIGSRGGIRVVPAEQAEAVFGSPQPSRADFERMTMNQQIDVLNGSIGACVQLHDDSGAVTEVAFWGISGD
ncbi:hypothetical protein ABH926_002559 [Catenulispora sp. GP43]|uniref:hypothetical protein n=1 Tax=Catenulispora sp. GP43 TaxID=3156263 RepID=UPI003513D901